jgi:hypothetical protein
VKLKQTTFFCFSPPVMVATFLVEISLLAYTLWRYKMSPLTRLAAITLSFLAIFQLAEYNVCGGMGLHAATWSRVGYVSITLLPALGFQLTHQIVGRAMNRWQALAYASVGLWIAVFGFSERAFTGYVCGGNYIIFQLKSPLGGLFFVWYYAWLLATMLLALRFIKTSNQKFHRALQAQIIGYSLFMVPTGIINIMYPNTMSGIPSIMCGFAVLFALTIVLGIMPIEKERVQSVKLPS